jgi:transcriptional regulator with XRE-family HTH domain
MATHLGDVLESQGRKQRWLAERIGVSGGYVSLIIAGERTVDRETGERIAALLDVPFFLLFALGVQSNIISQGEYRG